MAKARGRAISGRADAKTQQKARNARPARPEARTPPPPPEAFDVPPAAAAPFAEPQTGGLSLHDLFAHQAREMLDRTDLDEEQKQNVLVAMNCPCCGAGGMSFTAKIRRRS